MKKVNRFANIWIVGGWVFCGYQIFRALTIGEIYGISKNVRNVVQADSPIFYSFTFAEVMIVFLFLSLILSFQLYCLIDKKFKQYGGTYNINTAKAILRGWRK